MNVQRSEHQEKYQMAKQPQMFLVIGDCLNPQL